MQGLRDSFAITGQSSEVPLLEHPRPKSSEARDRRGSGAAACGQLCSRSSWKASAKRRAHDVKPRGECLVRSWLRRCVFNSGCRRRAFRLRERLAGGLGTPRLFVFKLKTFLGLSAYESSSRQ